MRALTKEEQKRLLRQQKELRKKRSKKSVAEAEQKMGITDAADVALVVPWSELHSGRFAELFKGLRVRRCESTLDFWSNKVRVLCPIACHLAAQAGCSKEAMTGQSCAFYLIGSLLMASDAPSPVP